MLYRYITQYAGLIIITKPIMRPLCERVHEEQEEMVIFLYDNDACTYLGLEFLLISCLFFFYLLFAV